MAHDPNIILTKKRIIGIDVARALAVIGMIMVNFKVVFGQKGEGWLKDFAHLFDGKAAATFVVLAGIGLALMTNSAVRDQNLEKLQKNRKRILKRAIFLFIVGLSYIWIWPADILHFYGVYMAIILLFINKSPKQILGGALALIAFYPVLMYFFDYKEAWNFATFEYADFWTIKGFLRNLFFNGFHPVIPWTAFMLFGLWFGRQNLYDDKFLKKSLGTGLIAFTFMQLLSMILVGFFSNGNEADLEQVIEIFGTNPMPPMPIYMINGISISVVIISGCILLAKRFENNWIIDALNKTGQMALTFYVLHVILGMGLVEIFGNLQWGEYPIEFSFGYALGFSLFCVILAVVWLRFRQSGPLEWIMRKATD